MENIDKIKCILIDFEIADKTLDEAAKEILLLFNGLNEQLSCDECVDGQKWSPYYSKYVECDCK